jgi:hypothetical protein
MHAHSQYQALRTNPSTSRVGMKWTPQEDHKLILMAKHNVHIEDMAEIYQRTIGGIKARIMMHALSYMKSNNVSIEESATYFNLTTTDLYRHQQYQQSKKMHVSKQLNTKDCMTLLSEIRDILKVNLNTLTAH